MDDGSLTVTDLSFDYGDTPILWDVSHAFRRGKLTAICGPNGSGKSTLFGLATGQLTPQGGHVRLGTVDVQTLAAKERAMGMAMLPQSPEAPSELLVRDLVALGRYAHRRPLSGLTSADRAAIEHGLEATQMAGLADRPLGSLSGGQRQRAWIAMALAQDAPLILLDEPTNHLDISHAVETLELLTALVREGGKTVIAILHDLNLMASHADDVLLLHEGRLFCAGPFGEAVTEENLEQVYGRQVQFGAVPDRDHPFIVVQ